MRYDIEKTKLDILRKHKKYQKYMAILFFLSLSVAAIVTMSLVQPAVTMSYKCGHIEHTHSESCYPLICEEMISDDEETTGEDFLVHSIDAGCYDMSTPICGEQEHIHTIECEVEEETAPDVLTAEEITELEENTETSAEFGTEENTDTTDEDVDFTEPSEDDESILSEPVATDVLGELTDGETSGTETTMPDDEEVIIASEVTATNKLESVKLLAGEYTEDTNTAVEHFTSTDGFSFYLVNKFSGQDGKTLTFDIEIYNDSDTDMYGSDGKVTYELASFFNDKYDYAKSPDGDNNSTSITFATAGKGDMVLEITSPNYMTYNNVKRLSNRDYGKIKYSALSKVNNSSYLEKPDGTQTLPKNQAGDNTPARFFYNDTGEPTFILPMLPLKSGEKYHISIQAELDVEAAQAVASTNRDKLKPIIGMNVNLYTLYPGGEDKPQIYSVSTLPDSKEIRADNGISFETGFDLNSDLTGHRNGLMKWKVILNNPNNFDLKGFQVYCTKFSSAEELVVSEYNSGIKKYEKLEELEKPTEANNKCINGTTGKYYVVYMNNDTDARGRAFVFNDTTTRNASMYMFEFVLPYKVWVGGEDINNINCVLETEHRKLGDTGYISFVDKTMFFQIDASMHGRVFYSMYYEEADGSNKAYTAKSAFEFDFGFNRKDGLSDKIFTCSVVPQAAGDNAQPLTNYSGEVSQLRLQIYAYFEYGMGEWDDQMDYYTGTLVDSQYYDATPTANGWNIKFLKDPITENPSTKNFTTCELRIVVPMKLNAPSLNNISKSADKVTDFTATGSFSNDTSAEAMVTVGKSFFVFDNRYGSIRNEDTTVHSYTEASSGSGLKWGVEEGCSAKYFGRDVKVVVNIPSGLEFNYDGSNDYDGLLLKVHDQVNARPPHAYDRDHWGQIGRHGDDKDVMERESLGSWSDEDGFNGQQYSFVIHQDKNRYFKIGKQFRIIVQTKLADGLTQELLKTDERVKCTADEKYAEFTLIATVYVADGSGGWIKDTTHEQTQRIKLIDEDADIYGNAEIKSFDPVSHTAVIEYTFYAQFKGKPSNKKLEFVINSPSGKAVSHQMTEEQYNGIKVYRWGLGVDQNKYPTDGDVLSHRWDLSDLTYKKSDYDANNLTITIGRGNDNGYDTIRYEKIAVVFRTTATLDNNDFHDVFSVTGSLLKTKDGEYNKVTSEYNELLNTTLSVDVGMHFIIYDVSDKKNIDVNAKNTEHPFEVVKRPSNASQGMIKWCIEAKDYTPSNDNSDDYGLTYNIVWPDKTDRLGHLAQDADYVKLYVPLQSGETFAETITRNGTTWRRLNPTGQKSVIEPRDNSIVVINWVLRDYKHFLIEFTTTIYRQDVLDANGERSYPVRVDDGNSNAIFRTQNQTQKITIPFGALLPATGGMGTKIFTIIGIAIVLCSVVVYMYNKRKNVKIRKYHK